MCTNPSDQYGVIEKLCHYNKSVMVSINIENIMLIARHINIAKRLTDIGKTIPLAFLHFYHPFLY